MAYVAPNGTIQLFRNIHLTPAYTDTIWFPNLATQNTVFSAQANYTFSNQMYTRVSGNRVRIHIVADEIRDCSYMRFQNVRGTKSKWFYAFITNVEYVNEQVSEVNYEIDEIQTWCFEVGDSDRFAECFIERQHATSDSLGSNLVPEPLHITENMVCNVDESIYSTNTYYLVVLGVSDLTERLGSWSNYAYGGLASTVHYVVFRTMEELSKFISNTDFNNGLASSLFGSNGQFAILAVYAVPDRYFPGVGNPIPLNTGNCYKMGTLATSETHTIIKPSISNNSKHGNAEDGYYEPKNNKIFTYPFSFIRIASPISEIDLKYELFFGSLTSSFIIKNCCNPEPAILISPIDYNGGENDFRNSLLVDGFPALTVYQTSQTGELVGRALKLAATTISNAVGAEGGEDKSDIGVGLLSNNKSAPLLSSAPATVKGGNASSFATHFANVSFGSADVTFKVDIYRMGLKKEFAEMFDNYFSRYGYAQNKIAKPNVHARMWWTYIKTRDCRCTVNAPASSLRKINAIMNEGITWWDYRVGVGEYGDFTNPTY